jgi:hypothetical protein
MTHRGLIGALLYAKDLDRLVEFYSSVAGIEPQTIEKGFAVLGSRPSQFVIVRIPKRIADTIDIATPPEPREDTSLKLVFGVGGVPVRAPTVEHADAIASSDSELDLLDRRLARSHPAPVNRGSAG